MRPRDLVLLILIMACFTGAIISVLVWQEQTRKRSAINVDLICSQLQDLTGKPCRLRRPPPK